MPTFIHAKLDGLIIVKPTVHGDSRGYFMETWNARDFEAACISARFVRDNQVL